MLAKAFFISVMALGAITSLQSYDVLTDYRLHGIENIQKKMDKELAKKSYWIKYLKTQDTTFGYLEKYSNVLACNKSKATLELYTKNSKGRFYNKDKHHAYTGKNKGDKQTEGDLRTPVGIYNIVSKKNQRNLDPFYGPLAFVTSYPNLYDKYRGKDGHGIWIHGFPLNNEKRNKYTKGCIALHNSNLQCLEQEIKIDNTVLIIAEHQVKKNIPKSTLAKILADLYAWRYAWIYNNIETYLNFYSSDFKRADGTTYRFFARYKRRIFNKKENKTIIFTNLNVIPYPGKYNVYQITFNEQYKSDTFRFNGEKELLVRFTHNHIKIFLEK